MYSTLQTTLSITLAILIVHARAVYQNYKILTVPRNVMALSLNPAATVLRAVQDFRSSVN